MLISSKISKNRNKYKLCCEILQAALPGAYMGCLLRHHPTNQNLLDDDVKHYIGSLDTNSGRSSQVKNVKMVT